MCVSVRACACVYVCWGILDSTIGGVLVFVAFCAVPAWGYFFIFISFSKRKSEDKGPLVVTIIIFLLY